MVRTITSLTHELIKDVVKLHSVKYRQLAQEFIAEGLRTISTIITAGHQPICVFVIEEFLDHAHELTDENNIIVVTSLVMKKISTTTSASGILATFAIPEQLSLDKLDSGIVLARVNDPGNAGTLLRTAAAMNKKTIVFIESVDAWNPKVIQASAGAIGWVNIFSLTWNELLHHKKKLRLCALISSQGKNPSSVNFSNALLVIGNEGNGIPI